MPIKALFLALILHVVEFSRYDRAPRTAITHRLQGRPPNLMHAQPQVNLHELKRGSKGSHLIWKDYRRTAFKSPFRGRERTITQARVRVKLG